MKVTPYAEGGTICSYKLAKVALQRLKLLSFVLVHRSPEPLFDHVEQIPNRILVQSSVAIVLCGLS